MASFAFVPLEGGNEIALEDGSVTLGRGPYLRIVDKRVSRHHAIVEVSGSTMTVLPIHTNPTFYKGFGATKFEPLEKNEAKELQNGDCIAFLPNDLVFKVLKKDKVNSFEEELKDETEEKSGHCVTDSKEECKMAKSKKLEEGNSLQIGVCEEEKEIEALLLKKSRILPSWMKNSEDKTPSNTSKKAGGTKAKKNESCAIAGAKTSVAVVEKKEEVDKKDHDDDIILVEKNTKRMENEEAVEEKEENVMSAESEEEEMNSNDSKKRKREKNEEEDNSPQATKRGRVLPPCPYGAECYRKNPVHFQEYSHTPSARSDSENNLSDDEGELPECPYGTSCFRKNRQHQKDYQHTATPRTRERKAKKKARLGGIKDDNDDALNDSDFEDSFIDDESESSCEPSENEDTQDSDWCPDEENSADEDVGQLLSEARNFAKNKKMMKPS